MRILFLSVVQSAAWLLISCTPLKETELSQRDDGSGNDGPYQLYNPYTRAPFDWDRFTFKPVSWTDRPPTDSKPFGGLPDELVVLIFVLPLLALFFIALIIKFVCNQACQSGEDESVYIHRPPVRYIAPPSHRTQQTFQTSTPVTTSTHGYTSSSINSPQGTGFETFSRGNDRVSGTSDAADKPPGYFDAVVTDSNAKFPETSSKPKDSPPPKYEEDTYKY